MSSFKKQPTMVSTVRYYNVCASNIAIDFLSIFYTCFCSFSHRYLLCYIFFSAFLLAWHFFFFLLFNASTSGFYVTLSSLYVFLCIFIFFMMCPLPLLCLCHCNFSTSTSNPSSVLFL